MKQFRTANRILQFSVIGGTIVICEKCTETPSGWTNRKWYENHVELSRDELVKALAYMDAQEASK